MKAILVLDEIPENCGECPLHLIQGTLDGKIDGYICFFKGMNAINYEISKRLDDCPLKEMPDRFPDDPDGQWDYDVGWNQCLDAIEGTEE